MIRIFSTIILLLLSAGLSFAQAGPQGIKIYSGYLYRQGIKHGFSVDRPCSIEFDSPVSFTHQSVSVLPEQLTYFIRFENGQPFKRFVINIYTNDDEEYSIDPDDEGRQVGVKDEHHIFDPYLIYLILGSDINHLEIVSPSGDNREKYVLDKLEVHDRH